MAKTTAVVQPAVQSRFRRKYFMPASLGPAILHPVVSRACAETEHWILSRCSGVVIEQPTKRGFALGDREALMVLTEWNARCRPPWTEYELEDKLRRARRYGREPIAALLRS
jgi:hypothetical protein